MQETLYDLEKSFHSIIEMLESNNGEVPEDILEALDTVEENIEAKLESYCKVIKNKESEIEVIDKEIERLKNKKETIEKTIDFSFL